MILVIYTNVWLIIPNFFLLNGGIKVDQVDAFRIDPPQNLQIVLAEDGPVGDVAGSHQINWQ